MATAFQRLAPAIQHALWDMNWTQLYGLQVEAINTWLDRPNDILLMANTAAGKTEAAFLPILSALAPDEGAGSVRALYIGPLKALINDQFRRLEDLCVRAHIPVHRWHGDVSSQQKKRLLQGPNGVLLITPESMESLLMRHGRCFRQLFSRLEAIVIDELHVFLDTARGRQLRSQLARLDAIRRDLPRARRLGLSATIGDAELASAWLSEDPEQPPVVIQSARTNPIELLVKTFVEEPLSCGGKSTGAASAQEGQDADDARPGLLGIADHVLDHFVGKTNLVFCNRKVDVEMLADIIGRSCQKRRLPNEFRVHHGSLSRQFREDVESELQSARPCTAICTSSLELGIDVGEVDAVGQVGPSHSVSALRQRLGRSGRKEAKPSRLFMYVPVVKGSDKSRLPSLLYPNVVQAVALVELMTGGRDSEKWVEPPDSNIEDYSTLIQQVLSVIVERGAAAAGELYGLLCASNTFGGVSQDLFAQLLRDMAERDLIEQTAGGELILGMTGEGLTSHYEFYAAFETSESYQVTSKSGPIGDVEGKLGFYFPGQFILLGGKRWRIDYVDESAKVIGVEPARGRGVVRWYGSTGNIHRRVREKMFEILCGNELPAWLESTSRQVLGWAREAFRRYDLASARLVKHGKELYLFPWTGTRAAHTLYLLFLAAGIRPGQIDDRGIALTISDPSVDAASVRDALDWFCSATPDPVKLVTWAFGEHVPPIGKHGWCLSAELRARGYAAAHTDVSEALAAASKLCSAAS